MCNKTHYNRTFGTVQPSCVTSRSDESVRSDISYSTHSRDRNMDRNIVHPRLATAQNADRLLVSALSGGEISLTKSDPSIFREGGPKLSRTHDNE